MAFFVDFALFFRTINGPLRYGTIGYESFKTRIMKKKMVSFQSFAIKLKIRRVSFQKSILFGNSCHLIKPFQFRLYCQMSRFSFTVHLTKKDREIRLTFIYPLKILFLIFVCKIGKVSYMAFFFFFRVPTNG
jgi:hypothetical protein